MSERVCALDDVRQVWRTHAEDGALLEADKDKIASLLQYLKQRRNVRVSIFKKVRTGA